MLQIDLLVIKYQGIQKIKTITLIPLMVSTPLNLENNIDKAYSCFLKGNLRKKQFSIYFVNQTLKYSTTY